MKTNGNFHFRKANITDKQQLTALRLSSYGRFRSVLGAEHWSRMENVLRDEHKMDELFSISECFVCECENHLVGMAYFVPGGNAWEMFPAEWSYIRMVGVDPEYAGMGIAKQLTNMCVDFAKSSGEKLIALHTSEFMDAARHIYENVGFTVHSELPNRFGKKYWLYTLEL